MIPILAGGAEMPTDKDLPGTMKTFAYRNAIRFDGEADTESEIQALVDAIREYRLPRQVIRSLRRRLAGCIALCLGLSATLAALWAANVRANSLEGVKQGLGRYDVQVRALADRSALHKAGSLNDEFMAASRSLDLFVFSGKSLAESEEIPLANSSGPGLSWVEKSFRPQRYRCR